MAQRKKHHVAVLTADIIQSTRYSRIERQKVNRVLLKSFNEVLRRYPEAVHTRFAFRITAGDEFQCVFSEIAKTFDILTYLRALVATGGLEPIVRFRASIGVGEISVTGRSNPYEEDGEAFVRSRQGLDQLNKGRHSRRTKILTGQPEIDAPADVVLLLLDYLQQSWTVPQWEAVKWSLLELTREEISKKLNVAHQNVSKRLAAAGWLQFRIASKFLGDLLDKADKP
jgi:SatD family protein